MPQIAQRISVILLVVCPRNRVVVSVYLEPCLDSRSTGGWVGPEAVWTQWGREIFLLGNEPLSSSPQPIIATEPSWFMMTQIERLDGLTSTLHEAKSNSSPLFLQTERYII